MRTRQADTDSLKQSYCVCNLITIIGGTNRRKRNCSSAGNNFNEHIFYVTYFFIYFHLRWKHQGGMMEPLQGLWGHIYFFVIMIAIHKNNVQQGPNNPAGYWIIEDPNIRTLPLQDTRYTFCNRPRSGEGGLRNILYPARPGYPWTGDICYLVLLG